MMNKHDMFVLSEGFIHETRLTSLLVCREGVSLCGYNGVRVRVRGRQLMTKTICS